MKQQNRIQIAQQHSTARRPGLLTPVVMTLFFGFGAGVNLADVLIATTGGFSLSPNAGHAITVYQASSPRQFSYHVWTDVVVAVFCFAFAAFSARLFMIRLRAQRAL